MSENNKDHMNNDDAFSIDAILNQSRERREARENEIPAEPTVKEPAADKANDFITVDDEEDFIEAGGDTIRFPELSGGYMKEFSRNESENTQRKPENRQPTKQNQRKGSKKPAKKMNKRKERSLIGTIIWISFIVVISIVISLSLITVCSDVLGIGKDAVFKTFRGSNTALYTEDGNPVTVQLYVKNGETLSSVAQRLDEKGLIIDSRLFRAYIKLKHIDSSNTNYGYHDFSIKMGYDEILDELSQKAKAEDLEVIVPPGKSIDEIADIMQTKGVCLAEQFKNAAKNGTYKSSILDSIPNDENIYYKVEGYLFPDTYKFYKNDDPERIIQKMIDNTDKKIGTKLRKAAADKGCTIHQILSLASVIELECCGYSNQMPKVSAVFWNRLNKWDAGQRLLGSDPTSNYKYGNGKYDTHKTEGIPIGPMCSVTLDAVKAAINPDKSSGNLFYFVTDTNSQFYFTSTYEEHLSIISSLKSNNLWGE